MENQERSEKLMPTPTNREETMKTKPEVQHTPTPWKLAESSHSRVSFIVSDKGYAIGDVDVSSVTPEEAEANAAFIVRVVNCHEELVGWIKQFIEDFGDDLKTPVRLHAKKLLAKAEGR